MKLYEIMRVNGARKMLVVIRKKNANSTAAEARLRLCTEWDMETYAAAADKMTEYSDATIATIYPDNTGALIVQAYIE